MDICIENSLDDISDEPHDIVSIDLTETDYHEIGETRTLNVGDEIEVYWKDDHKYYPGTVVSYCEQSGKHSIHYHYGDKETLDMGNEFWRALKANQETIADRFSINMEALETYFKVFAHKKFMLHQAEGPLPHPVWNAYEDEESKFLKTVREVCVSKVPKDSNTNTGRVLYKVKANDD